MLRFILFKKKAQSQDVFQQISVGFQAPRDLLSLKNRNPYSTSVLRAVAVTWHHKQSPHMRHIRASLSFFIGVCFQSRGHS